MEAITKDTTFAEIQSLLEDNDPAFIKIVKMLRDKQDSETDLFMAVVLSGIGTKENFRKNYISACSINRSVIKADTWKQNAGRVSSGNPGARDLDKNLKERLEKLDNMTNLESFINGNWYEIKGTDDKYIFKDEKGVSYFNDEKKIKKMFKEIAGRMIRYSTKLPKADPCELLRANKQLIMNGAPGTGKTYSARNIIADELLELKELSDERKKEFQKSIRMDMVQFHPSYDYTDFIEGIRPSLDSKTVAYSLKNGSFKRFCRRAGVIERIIASNKTPDPTNIKNYLKGEDKDIQDFWTDFWKENSKKVMPTQDSIDTDALPAFLFIIDEINRAEISKVLGETMFCLDPDYRGEKGRIATQYSSLATEESFYIDKDKDVFFIPSNVYIIGTMNDIDRSVEVFDFAMRRRFAWYEVTAEEVMDDVLASMGIDDIADIDYTDYCDRIKKINKSINEDLKLNEHYHLGPSYFAKIKLYMDAGKTYEEARKDVWNNHISQILHEYVKGKKSEDLLDGIGRSFIE